MRVEEEMEPCAWAERVSRCNNKLVVHTRTRTEISGLHFYQLKLQVNPNG